MDTGERQALDQDAAKVSLRLSHDLGVPVARYLLWIWDLGSEMQWATLKVAGNVTPVNIRALSPPPDARQCCRTYFPTVPVKCGGKPPCVDRWFQQETVGFSTSSGWWARATPLTKYEFVNWDD